MKRVVVESPLAGVKKEQCKYCGGEPVDGFVECAAYDGGCVFGPHGPPDFRRAIRYAQLCVLDCLQRGEAPFASHLIYTQVLDDRQGGEREHGMRAGFVWAERADLIAVYEDLGVSAGMQRALDRAPLDMDVVHRKLPPHLLTRLGEDPSLWETLK